MTLSNGQALVGAHIPTLVPLGETAKLPLDQRRRAGVLPRPRPSPGAPCPARAGRRVAVEGRGRFCWRQGTGRPERAPGPVLDLLAPVDHPGPARPRLLIRPGQPGRRQPPGRRAADPADPPRDPPPAHRPVPATSRTSGTAALVPMATPAPGHRPELSLPPTSPNTRMITNCRWSTSEAPPLTAELHGLLGASVQV